MENTTELNINVEVFTDAILSDSIEIQLEATDRLPIIAKFIGEQKTRDELLPTIEANVEHLNDEILLSIADKLEDFISLIGGIDHGNCLITILMKIASTDETLVRKRAVNAIDKIIQNFDEASIVEYIMPTIKKISVDSWFSDKCSIISLLHVCYPKVDDENKKILRETFQTIYEDNSPLVRKYASTSLIDLVKVIEVDILTSEYVPILRKIAVDDQDSVKINAPQIAIEIAKRLQELTPKEDVFNIILDLNENESWRIRQRVALLIDEIQDSFTEGQFRGKILNMYESMVKDRESEVRVIATQNLLKYTKSLKASYKNETSNFEPVFEQSIIPKIQLMLTDLSEDVRYALSNNILLLNEVFDEQFFKKNILPLVVFCLENEECLSLKENILKNLHLLKGNIDITKSLNNFEGFLKNLIETSGVHWRTRRSLLLTYVYLSKSCTKEYFNQNLLIHYMELLKDNIFSVRRTAPVVLPILAKNFGIKWVLQEVWPFLYLFIKNNSYLHRFIPLYAMCELIRPSIVKNAEIEYLQPLQLDAKKLYKIEQLNQKLGLLLQDKVFDIKFNDVTNISGENIRLYAEETLPTLEENNQIFGKTSKKMPYVEGLLILTTDFLKVLKTLLKDPTSNIVERSKYIVNLISSLNKKLNDELEQNWAKELLLELSQDEKNLVLGEIDENLTALDKKFDQLCVDPKDTELIQSIVNSNSSLPDLGKDITELNLDLDENVKINDEHLDDNLNEIEKITELEKNDVDTKNIDVSNSVDKISDIAENISKF